MNSQMRKPSGSASRADWMDYAIHEGHTRETLLDLTRNGIRDLVNSGPKQERSSPAPVIDEADAPVPDEAGDGDVDGPVVEAPPVPGDAPDYSQFLTPTGPQERAVAGEPAGQDPVEGADRQAPPVRSGKTVVVDGGGVRAVSINGTYQVTGDHGTRYTVSKGDVLDANDEDVARGVELGMLQRL